MIKSIILSLLVISAFCGALDNEPVTHRAVVSITIDG